MNQQIKKFWEDYYEAEIVQSEDLHAYHVKTTVDGISRTFYVAFGVGELKVLDAKGKYYPEYEGLKDEDVVYMFRGSFYTEEAMLRFIRLKAFL